MKKLMVLFLASLSFLSTFNAEAFEKHRVLFVVTNENSLPNGSPSGIHFNELTHPYYAFTDAGYEVEFSSIRGGNGPVDPATLEQSDPLNKRFWTNPDLRAKLQHTLPVRAVSVDDFDAIYIVGGVSTMWDFPKSLELQNLIAAFYERGAIIGGVCHGPAALVNVRLSDGSHLVSGKAISSFTNDEEIARDRQAVVPFLLESALVNLGAKFTKAAPFKYHVVSDGLLVTGQNPASAFGVAHEMIRLLRSGS